MMNIRSIALILRVLIFAVFLAAAPAAQSDAKIDLNDTAPTTLSGADGAVSGTEFTTTTTIFVPTSVGSEILIWGAGKSGTSFHTKIAAYVGPHAVTLSAAAPLGVSGKRFWWGQDATASVTAAYARARNTGSAISGHGAFWLASQSDPILLSSVSTTGDGAPVIAGAPYIQGGLTFIITGTASAVFTPGAGAYFSASVFYPAQDGIAPAPLPFPPVFDVATGGQVVNFTVAGSTFVNAWRVLTFEPGGGGGRIFWLNNRTFCLDRCFDLNNGLADIFTVDGDNYFGPGLYDAAHEGAATLAHYAAEHAELFHLDPGAPGSNYGAIDGLRIHGPFLWSMRYAVRLLSGLLDVSVFDSLHLDNVPTALSIEGSARYRSSAWTGGEIYALVWRQPEADHDVFAINSTDSTSELAISGVHLSFAQGNVLKDYGSGLHALNFSNNTLSGWGETAKGGGVYHAISMESSNGDTHIVVNGNLMECSPVHGNQADGVLLHNAAAYALTGNVLTNCARPLAMAGVSGAGSLFGNTTSGTTGPHALITALSGTATLTGGASTNSLDKP